MYRNISDEETVGKTVKGIHYGYMGDALMIVFDDETFAVFHASTETVWGETDLYIGNIVNDKVECFDVRFLDNTWIESGVITEEEFVALRDEKLARQKRKTMEGRRKQYERLQVEFEGE